MFWTFKTMQEIPNLSKHIKSTMPSITVSCVITWPSTVHLNFMLCLYKLFIQATGNLCCRYISFHGVKGHKGNSSNHRRGGLERRAKKAGKWLKCADPLWLWCLHVSSVFLHAGEQFCLLWKQHRMLEALVEHRETPETSSLQIGKSRWLKLISWSQIISMEWDQSNDENLKLLQSQYGGIFATPWPSNNFSHGWCTFMFRAMRISILKQPVVTLD